MVQMHQGFSLLWQQKEQGMMVKFSQSQITYSNTKLNNVLLEFQNEYITLLISAKKVI